MWIIDRSGVVEANGVGKNRHQVVISVLVLCLFSLFAKAEPWLDTHNAPLRADIEQLSRAGIISVPINTWPLMWSGILNDLERRDSVPRALSLELQNSLTRVLTAGRHATRVDHHSPISPCRFRWQINRSCSGSLVTTVATRLKLLWVAAV